MKKTLQISSLTLVFLFSMFIQAHPTEVPSKKTKTYVLVQSAWLGAWQWQQVAQTLETAGHTVITPDWPVMEVTKLSQAILRWKPM